MPSNIRNLRRQAFHRQGGRCCYCDVVLWLESPVELMIGPVKPRAAAPLRCTAEHLSPRCEGGRNASDNIAAACAHCNSTRHKRKRPPDPAEYRKNVRARVRRGKWHPRWVFDQRLLPPHCTDRTQIDDGTIAECL
jgi:5-methylcytosine-specific restriction endonuclease McrA